MSFAGLDSGFPGNAGATVDAAGRYTLPALPTGAYPYLVGRAGTARHRPAVQPRGRRADERPARPAGAGAASGGGQIIAFTGDDNSRFG